jgi:periplasmic protein CpxP/Spy
MGRRQPITTHRHRPFITATERLAQRASLPALAPTTPFQIADNVKPRNDSMKTIRSNHFASAAIIALLALPAAALAQPTQSPAPAAPQAAPSSPMTSQPVPGKNMEERVENHIKQLHAQLQITPAEQPQWDQFAQVMRENARDMDQAFIQRAQQYPTMNAMQNMQSYEQIAEAHARHLQKLVPAFDNLYNAMPEQQKKLTDQVFRANAERQAARSRHGATAN